MQYKSAYFYTSSTFFTMRGSYVSLLSSRFNSRHLAGFYVLIKAWGICTLNSFKECSMKTFMTKRDLSRSVLMASTFGAICGLRVIV